MFELSKHKAVIAHLNIREEMHGEEKILAEDIKIQADVPNDFLSYLAPTLKWSLFDRPDAAQVELIKEDGHMPRLRYSQLAPIAWEGKMERATFVIHPPGKAKEFEFGFMYTHPDLITPFTLRVCSAAMDMFFVP